MNWMYQAVQTQDSIICSFCGVLIQPNDFNNLKPCSCGVIRCSSCFNAWMKDEGCLCLCDNQIPEEVDVRYEKVIL